MSELRIQISAPTMVGREEEYVLDALRSNAITMGKYVSRFETAVASSAKAPFAAALSSGTAALHTALLALNLKPYDTVVLPALTYIATANAVKYCGAIPVFVDVDPATWTMDVHAAVSIARRYSAVGIISVDLYGVPCSLPPKSSLGNIWLLEDLCEAHGAALRGNAAVFSYYGNKIVTCGEGGAVVTDSPSLIQEVRILRGQGTTGKKRYVHEMLGFNYRMTDLQAAIGCAQYEQLGALLKRRAGLRSAYDELLPPTVGRQRRSAGSVDWVMPVVVENREHVVSFLRAKGIETRPVFPPLHHQPIYDRPQSFPATEMLSEKGLLLPLHAGMTINDVEYICNALRRAL